MANQLDLLIIHPGAAHGIYGELGDTLVAVEPPLWCRLIAGYVRDKGHTVKIIDAEAMGWSPERVAAQAASMKPRLICIAVYGHQPSASTQQMTGARATARAIKTRYPFPIIMVGGHIAALPERTLREEVYTNYIATGEGPITIERLLAGDKDADIPGLGWHSNWRESMINDPAPLMDIADLHGDAWDLLPMRKYRSHNWQAFGLMARQPYASIHTSLGCPYKCSFCCINAPFASNRYRMRDPKAVVDEIEMLYKEHGVRTFKIVDEMFVLNEKHYTAIAEGLIDLQYRYRLAENPVTLYDLNQTPKIEPSRGHPDLAFLNIWAYSRIDTVKPDKLALLRAAGIKWLALGIESGSAHVRDGASKALKNNDIIEVVRAIQAAGINVIGNYIFGLPDDDFKTMGDTFNLAVEANTEFANFYSAMAYPGSRLYTEALASGATLPETWRGYSQHNDDCRPLDTKFVTGADVLRFRDDAFNVYFARPRYHAMIAEKFGPETLAHIHEMTNYKLHRKLLEAAAE